MSSLAPCSPFGHVAKWHSVLTFPYRCRGGGGNGGEICREALKSSRPVDVKLEHASDSPGRIRKEQIGGA